MWWRAASMTSHWPTKDPNGPLTFAQCSDFRIRDCVQSKSRGVREVGMSSFLMSRVYLAESSRRGNESILIGGTRKYRRAAILRSASALQMARFAVSSEAPAAVTRLSERDKRSQSGSYGMRDHRATARMRVSARGKPDGGGDHVRQRSANRPRAISMLTHHHDASQVFNGAETCAEKIPLSRTRFQIGQIIFCSLQAWYTTAGSPRARVLALLAF